MGAGDVTGGDGGGQGGQKRTGRGSKAVSVAMWSAVGVPIALLLAWIGTEDPEPGPLCILFFCAPVCALVALLWGAAGLLQAYRSGFPRGATVKSAVGIISGVAFAVWVLVALSTIQRGDTRDWIYVDERAESVLDAEALVRDIVDQHVRFAPGLINGRVEMANVTDSSDGSRWQLALDDVYGGELDLWASRIAEDGSVEAPVFVGCLGAPPFRASHKGLKALARSLSLSAQMRDGVLHVEGTMSYMRGTRYAQETPVKRITASLDEIKRDSDGDGLTDVLEGRLGTDPDKADTDGDRVGDLADAMPLLAPAARISVGQWMLREAFVRIPLVERDPNGYVDTFMIVRTPRCGEFPLRNPCGITLFLTEDEIMELQEEIGRGFLVLRYHRCLGPSQEEYPIDHTPFRFSEDLEKAVVQLGLYIDQQYAVGYDVYFERSQGKWTVADVQARWVS